METMSLTTPARDSSHVTMELRIQHSALLDYSLTKRLVSASLLFQLDALTPNAQTKLMAVMW
jgi:hypothetical protein